jgi:hypothetical protein
MRTTGNSLIMPGAVERKKNMSAFKTISFLVSFPENEPGINFSDKLSGEVGNNSDVQGMRGD